MKVTVTGPELSITCNDVRRIASEAGMLVSDVQIIDGTWSNKLRVVINYHDQEQRPCKTAIVKLVNAAGGSIDRADIRIIPTWAARLVMA